jgi:hypothetical protein
MQELLQECIKLVNLPYTALFGLSLLYWILYLAGVLGSDFLDFLGLDFGADVEVDAELGVDADLDADLEMGPQGGALAAVMRFVHGGDVPLTVIVSALNMSMWTISLLANYYLKNSSVLIALGLFVPILVLGIITTKLALMPFVPLLKRAFDESGDAIEMLGKPCVVTSIKVTSKYGQAEIPKKGSPLVINVKSKEGETLARGDEAVVYGRDPKDDVYLVTGLGLDTETLTGDEKGTPQRHTGDPEPDGKTKATEPKRLSQ